MAAFAPVPTIQQKKNLQDATVRNTLSQQFFSPGNQVAPKQMTTYYPATGQTVAGAPKTNLSNFNPNPVYNQGTGTGQGGFNTRSTPTLPPPIAPVQKPPTTPGATPPPPSTPGTTPNAPVTTSWLNPDGTYKKDFTPSTEDELNAYTRQITDSNDPYASAKIAAATQAYQNKSAGTNLSSVSGGVNFNPTSLEESAQTQQALNEQKTTQLDKQIAEAKAKAQREADSSSGAVKGSVGAVSREGVVSEGNQMASNVISGTIHADLQSYNAQLDQQKTALQNAIASGNTEAATQIGKAISQTQQAMQARQIQFSQMVNQTLQTLSSTGALTGLGDDQLQAISESLGNLPMTALQAIAKVSTTKFANDQQKQQLDALDTFKGLAASGTQMSPEFIAQQAKSTGIPMEQLVQFNSTAQAIMADKTLSNDQKKQLISEEGYKLDQYKRGVFTKEAQTVDYLSQMYKDGASPEQIAAYKSIAGITDYNDPLTKAKLEGAEVENRIKTKQANGQPVTIQDWNAQADYLKKMAELGQNVPGNASAYIPSSPVGGMKVTFNNGVLNVTTPVDANGQPVAFQCGAGVNRVWGMNAGDPQGMGSNYSDKTKWVDSRGIKSTNITDPDNQIIPGMAFVMPIGGKLSGTGHTGLVKQNLGGGKFLTSEWNWDGKGGYSEQVRDYSQMYGFARPPGDKASVLAGNGNKQVSALGKVEKDLRSAVTQKANQFDSEPQVKNFQVIQEGKKFVDSMSSDSNNPADDQAFIYAFAKIMDPNSVVREGEYATVQKYAQTWADTFGYDAKRTFSNGKFLTPEAINNMKSTIDSKYKASEASYDQFRNEYVRTIDNLAGQDVGKDILQDYKINRASSGGDSSNLGYSKPAKSYSLLD